MQLESVRELKASLTRGVVTPLVEGIVRTKALRVAAQPVDALQETHRGIALGVGRKGKQYHLAVRVQRRELMEGAHIERIRKAAKGEVDIVYIGRVTKRAAKRTAKSAPWYQQRQRPLLVGCSVGHFHVTAGTLGGCVKDAESAAMILSNNHVLADENRGKSGDAIVQPGAYDGGKVPDATAAHLGRFVALHASSANRVDCAVAPLAQGIEYDPSALKSIGKLAGVRETDLAPGDVVHKVGRTTGVTGGRVTATELDYVVVGYDIGNLRFDDQIEIEGAGKASFSDGGDSGSLIVDDATAAAALLFAGGDQGGSNGLGLTYANPIRAVLAALKVELVY